MRLVALLLLAVALSGPAALGVRTLAADHDGLAALDGMAIADVTPVGRRLEPSPAGPPLVLWTVQVDRLVRGPGPEAGTRAELRAEALDHDHALAEGRRVAIFPGEHHDPETGNEVWTGWVVADVREGLWTVQRQAVQAALLDALVALAAAVLAAWTVLAHRDRTSWPAAAMAGLAIAAVSSGLAGFDQSRWYSSDGEENYGVSPWAFAGFGAAVAASVFAVRAAPVGATQALAVAAIAMAPMAALLHTGGGPDDASWRHAPAPASALLLAAVAAAFPNRPGAAIAGLFGLTLGALGLFLAVAAPHDTSPQAAVSAAGLWAPPVAVGLLLCLHAWRWRRPRPPPAVPGS